MGKLNVILLDSFRIEKKFNWLIEHLLPASEKIWGCELIFPDTALFFRGKPKVIIRNDRECCLMAVKLETKLNLQSIYKDFSNVVRERKKDFQGIFNTLFSHGQDGISRQLKLLQTHSPVN